VRDYNRRTIIASACGTAVWFLTPAAGAADDARFAAEAERMKQQAIASGDQPYGAVIVIAREIVGYGPSRVVVDGNSDAHAERIALQDAQRRTGSQRLDGAVIYSTSIPCAVCQRSLKRAGVARMRFGPEASDAGVPQGD
jgi:tRNA(adenine34) deaminase